MFLCNRQIALSILLQQWGVESAESVRGHVDHGDVIGSGWHSAKYYVLDSGAAGDMELPVDRSIVLYCIVERHVLLLLLKNLEFLFVALMIVDRRPLGA